MGKYQAYPEYKDSGVEWLGDIPISWIALPIKMVSKIFNGATPKSGVAPFWDGDIPWVTPADLGKSVSPYISKGSRSITAAGYNSCGVSLVPKNSIILASRAPIGTLGIASNDLCTNQGCKSLVVKDRFVPEFLYYVLLSSTEQLNLLGRGSTFLELSADDLGSYKIPSPSECEQQKIASFLDHETAKIDTLIDKQQQLIQLLKEKRQAVISHAVTKGLNPNAPMRDSGVEWLGEVPEHWIVSKVKFEYENLDWRRIPLSTEERSYRQGDYPYYGASGIIDYVDDYIFDEGLVLVSEDGANLLARSSKIAFPAYGKYWVNNHAHILRPKDENVDFWSEVIEVRDLTPYISGAAQPKFTSEALSDLVVAVPANEAEIRQIAEHIREQKEKYSNLISKANKSIKLMQERRTALISAAVTGKIDVRHLVCHPTGDLQSSKSTVHGDL